MTATGDLHGVLGEFAGPEQLVAAARRAREAGWQRLDAFAPWPVEGLEHALGLPPSRLGWLVLGGGLLGAAGGFLLQTWTAVSVYPFDVGGRSPFSWPAFVVPTFETTILVAGLTAVLGMFALSGLPMPYHPLFHVERFAHASSDAYFLLVEARDPRFDPAVCHRLLRELGAEETWDVPE